MGNLIKMAIGVLCIISLNAYSQDLPYIGMTTTEFKMKLPGILPEKVAYSNDDLKYEESIYDIKGFWTFEITDNILNSADFKGDQEIESEAAFNRWTETAKRIIADYTKIYGKPFNYKYGTNKFSKSSKTCEGKRDLFYEAVWKTKTTLIKISCDNRSNYYEEYAVGAVNGPTEDCYYSFKITHSPISEVENKKAHDIGRFYSGMDVNDFAKLVPSLFPSGVKTTGTWGQNQDFGFIKGAWAYGFEEDTLNWINFSSSTNEINQANFGKYLFASKRFVQDYTKSYGQPTSTVYKDTAFIYPFKEKYFFYDVVTARWENYKNSKIKISYSFDVGKNSLFSFGITFCDAKNNTDQSCD